MIEQLKKELSRASCAALTADGTVFRSVGRGIMPLFFMIMGMGKQTSDASFADKIVGKGAAILLCDAKAKAVYGEVMSASAKALFDEYGVETSYATLTDEIVNREGTGPCPLEQSVRDCVSLADGKAAVNAFIAKINGVSF